jgi:integrase/recombinase XerD
LRYCPAVITPNGRIKQDIVLVNGKEERHPEGAYYLDWRTNGVRVRLSVGKNAQDALAQRDRKTFELNAAAHGIVVQSEEHGSGPNGNRKPLSVAVADFLEDKRLSKKSKTHAAYSTALSYFAESCAKLYAEDIDRRDMLKFCVFLRDVKGQAPRSVHNQFALMLGFLRAQGVVGLVKQDDWPSYTEEEPEVYEQAELDTLFAACDAEERL